MGESQVIWCFSNFSWKFWVIQISKSIFYIFLWHRVACVCFSVWAADAATKITNFYKALWLFQPFFHRITTTPRQSTCSSFSRVRLTPYLSFFFFDILSLLINLSKKKENISFVLTYVGYFILIFYASLCSLLL